MYVHINVHTYIYIYVSIYITICTRTDAKKWQVLSIYTMHAQRLSTLARCTSFFI